MIVCDGMGGANKGDYASKAVINTLQEAFINRKRFYNVFDVIHFLHRNLRKINKELYKTGDENKFYKGKRRESV